MGTRNLTVVVLDGKHKIAQYGQWDGYPSGQGAKILDFLNNHMDRPKFEKKLRATKWITDRQCKNIQKRHDAGEFAERGGWPKVYPELSRDTGAGILKLVLDSKPGIKLKDDYEFSKDSLYCEYAYVLDLDANVLEVYKGFNKRPLPKTQKRFRGGAEECSDTKYCPVRLKATYRLDKLPTVDAMVKKVGD